MFRISVGGVRAGAGCRRSGDELYINGKPRGGTSVVAWNTKLEGSAEVESRRKQWRAALDSLKQHLS